jgi:hypothetical protein
VHFCVTVGCRRFIAVSYKECAAFGRNNHNVRKIINTVNYTYSTIRHFQLQALVKREFKRLDENARLVPFEALHITVLVLILGETARREIFRYMDMNEKRIHYWKSSLSFRSTISPPAERQRLFPFRVCSRIYHEPIMTRRTRNIRKTCWTFCKHLDTKFCGWEMTTVAKAYATVFRLKK